MKNIHVLPTDKPSRLYKTGSFLLLDSRTMPNNTLETKNQYIYITNDSEIKVGDWCLGMDGIFQYKGKINIPDIELPKKIILTTDQDLIKDGIQAIDDEFLEWFVKNPSCEEVEIELFPKFSNKLYGIIIPKEEPKQETLEEAAERYVKQFDYAEDSSPQIDFIAGAKWQQERSYSEEDMIEFGFSTYCYISELMGVPFNLMSENRLNAEEWFEQFKKK